MQEWSAEIKTQYNQRIIEVFSAFIQLCERHNLQYFCCGGTAIGVVRHQGMIPWDDDIDILMPRPDYERFITLFPTLGQVNYELIEMRNTKAYYLPFAKFCAKNTTILENSELPCVLGAYIDIFPLDAAADTATERISNLRKFRSIANALLVLPKRFSTNIKTGFIRLFNMHLRSAKMEFQYAINKNVARKKVVKQIDDIMQAEPYNEAAFVGNFGGMWEIKEFAPKAWFDGYVLGDFEGLKVRLPKEYHLLLTQVYGDYMQLPPVDKQISHHNFAYINLNERKSLEEVLTVLNKNK